VSQENNNSNNLSLIVQKRKIHHVDAIPSHMNFTMFTINHLDRKHDIQLSLFVIAFTQRQQAAMHMLDEYVTKEPSVVGFGYSRL
jgi:hypothetical protein